MDQSVGIERLGEVWRSSAHGLCTHRWSEVMGGGFPEEHPRHQNLGHRLIDKEQIIEFIWRPTLYLHRHV